MATAEFAAAVPALILVLVLALSAITTVTDQVRCVDAARATARALARGDGDGDALALGRRLAPPGATFSVARTDGEVSVVVSGSPSLGLRWLGSVASPTGQAVAAREDAPAFGEPAGTGSGTMNRRRGGWPPGKFVCPLGRERRGDCAPRLRRSEGGSVTVVVVAALGVAVVLLVGGLALASAVDATHRARTAADLGALAAAQAIQRGFDSEVACALAASLTARNGARPQACVVAGDGSVTSGATTTASFTLPGLRSGTTTATSRAGPSP